MRKTQNTPRNASAPRAPRGPKAIAPRVMSPPKVPEARKTMKVTAPIIAVIPAIIASSKILLSRVTSETSLSATRISIHPTRLIPGMIARIPPTPPRTLAFEREAMEPQHDNQI